MVSISRCSLTVGARGGFAADSLLRGLRLLPMEAEGRDVRLPVPVVLDDGPDGGSVLKASPSWRAHAATTRLTKKDFMVTAGMEIMDDVGANKIMLLMRCPVRRQHLLSSNAAAGLSTLSADCCRT